MGTKSAWTPERRARQADIIRITQPWMHSTGPRTPEGKAASSRNAEASAVRIMLKNKLAEARAKALLLNCRERMPKRTNGRSGPTRGRKSR